MAFGRGMFVSVGQMPQLFYPGIMVSNDGNVWTLTFSATSKGQFERICYGDGTFVAIGGNSIFESQIISGDGLTWGPLAIVQHLKDITYGSGRFVAVGNGGVVIASSDGTNWVTQTSGTSENLDVVAFGGGLFLAVGDSGAVIRSLDGSQWESVTTAGLGLLSRLSWGGGVFLGVGPGGLIQSTKDGAQWLTHDSKVKGNLKDIVYFKGRFYAVGLGAILQSGKVHPFKLDLKPGGDLSQINIQISAESSAFVRLQVSPDLNSWQDWKSFTNTGETTNFIDTASSGNRFYRAVAP